MPSFPRRDDFSARYSNGRQDVPIHVAQPLVFPASNTTPFQAGVLNLTHTFSPSLVNEARIGLNRIVIDRGFDSKGLGNVAEDLGIAQGNALTPGLMSINFGGFSSSVGSADVGRQLFVADNTYQYSDNLTILRGRHMMKTGFLFMHQQFNWFDSAGGKAGSMSFGGLFTSGPNTSTPTSVGFGIADFFLGFPGGLQRGNINGTIGQRGNITGLYYQDDWRVTDTLTLNLGFRWEYHSPWSEVHDRQANFSPFTGQLELPGQNGNPRGLYNSHFDDYQPRTGLAWTPKFLGGKTVFRAAYGISSYLEGTGTSQRLPLNPPFSFTYANTYFGPQVGSTTEQGLTVLQIPGNPYANEALRVWDPNVQPCPGAAMERHHRTSVARPDDALCRLCGTARYSSDGCRTLRPEGSASQRDGSTQPLPCREPAVVTDYDSHRHGNGWQSALRFSSGGRSQASQSRPRIPAFVHLVQGYE